MASRSWPGIIRAGGGTPWTKEKLREQYNLMVDRVEETQEYADKLRADHFDDRKELDVLREKDYEHLKSQAEAGEKRWLSLLTKAMSIAESLAKKR